MGGSHGTDETSHIIGNNDMRATILKDTLKSLVKIGRPVAIEGAPGGGKTTIVREVAKELDLHYIEKHMPTMLVEDFGTPWPTAESDTFSYKLPDWFPAKGSKYDDGRGGILCFDDRNQADTSNQKVLANIQQARTLHGKQMADGWSVVSTGNRQSDRAGANKVLSHLRNRETVLEFETHLDDSTRWMLDNGVRPEVIAFTRFRPHLLHDFDPQRDVNPTPRSWVEGVSAILGKVPAEAEYECFKGAIDEGAAAEFVGFIRIYRKLPNPDAILINPDTADVPTDPATLYALSGALAERATSGNFERVVTYTGRMPAEFSVLSVSMAVRRDADLASTQAFTKWALAHQDVLF
jgi:hypothetical protein